MNKFTRVPQKFETKKKEKTYWTVSKNHNFLNIEITT